MSLSGRWYGFGRSPQFDAALRAFEAQEFNIAIELLRELQTGEAPHDIKKQGKSFLVAALSFVAKQRTQEGDAIEGRELYREALELEPKYPDLWLGLAMAAGRLGDDATERGAVAKAREINPEYGRALLYEALIALKAGDPKSAAETLSRLGDNAPSGPDDLLIQAIQAALESEGDEANRLATQADMAVKEQEYEIASSLYRQAAQLKPNYADVRCKWGQTLLQLDKLEDAEAQCRAAIEINPNYAEAWAQLGIALNRQKKRGEAKQAFLKAYALDPFHPIAKMEVKRTF